MSLTDRSHSKSAADDFVEMRRQAHRLSSWGPNVYVKIPVTNTEGISSVPLIADLTADGVHLNVTGILTLAQVREVTQPLSESPGAVVSVFAGRVADTGRDPVPLMAAAVELLRPYPNLELLWASPREVLNVSQAESIGCDIITVTHDLLKKLGGLGLEPGGGVARYSKDVLPRRRRRRLPAVVVISAVLMTATGQPDDDWNRHWGTFGDAVSGNPATATDAGSSSKPGRGRIPIP